MAKSGKPTINDVARLASVSKKTVSRVINNSPLLSEKTRKHVEQVIAEDFDRRHAADTPGRTGHEVR